MGPSASRVAPPLFDLVDPAAAAADELTPAPVDSFSSARLRQRLSGARRQLSRRRKIAVIVPLVIAVMAWFLVPSYANGLSQSVLASVHASAHTATGPSAADVSGNVSVAPAGKGTVIPVTGAGTGMLRELIVGLCLMVAGFALATAPRRNPHAEAVWHEMRGRPVH